jgi:hypothetical protein
MSPFQRFLRRFSVVWIIIFGVILGLFILFIAPLSPFHRCTLIGCQDTLELSLSHEPPSRYAVVVTASTGEARTITCTPSVVSAASDVSTLCRTGIITIYGFTPSQVTVDISWQGGNYSTNGRPTYETFRPNGIFCPPTCRLARLLLEVP